jgi:REP element-mobilizing transposase RayT
MVLEKDRYYHFYNRTNNNELLFKEEQNYQYFLSLFKKYLDGHLSVSAYCLMPTHFHFLITVLTEDQSVIRTNIAAMLSGYTKAINRMYLRHGSLFQPRSKAKEIDDERYLLTLITYIHQNPMRSRLTKNLNDWNHSSYPALIGRTIDPLLDQSLVRSYFPTHDELQKYSMELIPSIRSKYWI